MDPVPFIVSVSEEEIRRQRRKAKELRSSQWWKRRCFSGLCYYCGKKVPPRSLTMDHIVPIVRGGKSAKGNLVPACKECNSKKQSLVPVEWEEHLRRLASSDDR